MADPFYERLSLLILGLLLRLPLVASSPSQVDYSQYVNVFMGSEGPFSGQSYGGGDIFIGGARPFGVTKVGIDTTATNWSTAVLNGGWTPDGNVTAISRQPSLCRGPNVIAHILISFLSYDARKRHWRSSQVRNHPSDAPDQCRLSGKYTRQYYI